MLVGCSAANGMYVEVPYGGISMGRKSIGLRCSEPYASQSSVKEPPLSASLFLAELFLGQG